MSDLGGLSLCHGVRRTTLANGLTVLTKEMHTHPIVSSVLWYRVGARNELLGRTGTSHFLEHMLFKGTQKFGKGAIDLLTLKNGGSNNAFTWLDYTAYYFSFASDRWEIALEIEADRMRNTLFEQSEFESEKKVVIEELKIGLDGPWDQLEHEVWATAFRQHPYRNPTVGWIEDLADATAADMKSYYDTWYHPRNATLVLVGDFETDRVIEKIKDLFEPIPAGPEPPKMGIVEPRQSGEKRVVVHKTTPVERLLMAWHVPEVGHPDCYAIQVVESALSLGKTSRLYRRLIESDRSVTVCSASYNDHIDPSLFTIRAEVKPGFSIDAVESAILEEIEKIAAEGIPEDHLARIKRRVRADIILTNEQILNQAILLGEYETVAVGPDLDESSRGYKYLDTYLERVQATTSDEVRDAARKYLTTANRTVGRLLNPDSQPGGGADSGDRQPEPIGAGAHRSRPGMCFRGPVGREDGGLAAIDPSIRAAAPKIAVEHVTLANGLTVLLAPNDGIPAFCCNVVFNAGSRYESDDEAGMASLTGTLLEDGTANYSSHQIAEAIEDLGAHLSTYGGFTHSGARIVGLTEDLDRCVALAAECVRRPVFPEDRVRLHIDRRVALLKSRADQSRIRAGELFDEYVFRGHPNHRPGLGYEESVAKLTREHFVRFHAEWFHPNNATLSIAGRFDRDEALAVLEKHFGDWTANPHFSVPEIPEITRQIEPIEQYLHAEKEQVNLYLGHLGIRRSHPDYYALLVLDTILGSSPGFTSRIPRVLRDEQGLAYTTFSNISGSAGIDPGRFVAFIGTSPGNLERAVEGLRREIRRIVDEPVEMHELETAKSYLTGSFVFRFQTNAQIAGYLIDAHVFELGFDFLERYPKLIQEITVEEVLRVAREHINPDAMTLVVVGPKA